LLTVLAEQLAELDFALVADAALAMETGVEGLLLLGLAAWAHVGVAEDAK